MKKKMKTKKEDIILKLFMIFLIMQPILDIYLLYTKKVIDFIGFSPATIIRILFVTILFMITFSKLKYKKHCYWLFGYAGVILLYTVLHIYSGITFNADIPKRYYFSVADELFYIVRMMIPFAIAFITYYQKITFEHLKKIIISSVYILSLIIIVSNIFKFSLTSYPSDTKFIQANIFEWFLGAFSKYPFEGLASKGLFNMANSTSALMLILLPITIYFTIKENSKVNFAALICQIIAMIMLGTRVASYGWAMVFIVIFIIYLFFCFIKKEYKFELNKTIVLSIIFLVFIGITFMSPIRKSRYYIEDFVEKEKNESSEKIVKERENEIENLNKIKNKEKALEYIKNNYNVYNLRRDYVFELYSYKEDYTFWLDVMRLNPEKRIGNRNMQKLVTARIIEKSNRGIDKYLGVGFSRMRSGEVYIENDFLAQYYTIGLLGIMVLMGYYLVAFVLCGYNVIKNYNSKFRFQNVILLASVFLMFGTAVLTGHVMDELIVTIYAGFILGVLLRNIYIEDKKL